MNHLRKRTTCTVPGHGARCVVAQEKDHWYGRSTEERMAMEFEERADEELVRGYVSQLWAGDWDNPDDAVYDWADDPNLAPGEVLRRYREHPLVGDAAPREGLEPSTS